MGNGTKRVLQEVDDKASGNPDSKAAKTETEAFNLAYSWVEWLKTGADVKVCSIGDDSNDDIVVTLEPKSNYNEEYLERLFFERMAGDCKKKKVEDEEHGLTFQPLPYGPFGEAIEISNGNFIVVPRGLEGPRTRGEIRLLNKGKEGQRLTKLEHKVFDFSTAGKTALSAWFKREMRCCVDQYGEPADDEEWHDWAVVSFENTIYQAKFVLKGICESFKKRKQHLDYDVLGAHLLEEWRKELWEYGVSCRYYDLKVKELQALCELRSIPSGYQKKDLVKALMESDIEIHDNSPAIKNNQFGHRCSLCYRNDLRTRKENGRNLRSRTTIAQANQTDSPERIPNGEEY